MNGRVIGRLNNWGDILIKRCVKIRVLEESLFATTKPVETIRRLDDDTFVCPKCRKDVHITQRKYYLSNRLE